jgi:YidC/Oxa1 family membrane protein insertase
VNEQQGPRLLLAFGLSMAVLMVWQAIFPAPEPFVPESPGPEVSAPIPEPAPVPLAAPTAVPTPSDPLAAPSPEVPAVAAAEIIIRLTDEHRVIGLSSHGARLVEAKMSAYREPGTDPERPIVDLVPAGAKGFGGLKAKGLAIDAAYRVVEQSVRHAAFEVQVGRTVLRRTWTLSATGLTHRIDVSGGPAPAEMTLFLEMMDPTTGGGIFAGLPDLTRALCHDGEDLEAYYASDLDPVEKAEKEPFFVGVDRNYFGAFWMGLKGTSCRGEKVDYGDERVGVAMAVTLGDNPSNESQLLLMPKGSDALAEADEKLISVIDFGVFKFIAQPMLWLLLSLYGFVGNYGLAIILLTLIVKAALFPITDMSFRSMAKMKAIQPKIEVLKKKHGADKQAMAQAQMQLFREEGVNPAGGCLPMLLQIPVWFALYSTLRVAVELYGSPFIGGWIDDLTLPDPYYILPVVLGGLFFIQQKFQPQMSDNPSQKIVMKVMPVMMTVLMVTLPSGLVVYILCNTMLGILHQMRATKRDAPAAA